MPTLQVPPGRMGRLWLTDRLELAERGVSLLEEKLRLLGDRREELRDLTDGTRRAWYEACREADTWSVRAALLCGQRALESAAPLAAATVTIESRTTTGVDYPWNARCEFPPVDSATVVHSSSATVQASRAHRTAVDAAARHAVAEAALATIEREYSATRLRVRALSKHWVPRLRDELARITLELEENDRAESVRSRLAQRSSGAPGGTERRSAGGD